ncbi:uncharacterized protein JCM6883_006632 [Sporobolomyces salmoneus]|uniref:uncharacterized protein n=1 Tax=Sporobolomyces salmoneus TaxID=183962 RepID=UPI003171E7F4
MSKPPPTLPHLPPTTLERIIRLSLDQGNSPLSWLSEFGSIISQATERVLATTLTLPDDDSILLAIEEASRERESTAESSKDLLIIQATRWAHLVQHLEVVRPLRSTEEEEPEEIPHLDDSGFLNLLERFPNLSSFTWNSSRLPPEDLCIDLSNSVKSLKEFKFDLVPVLVPDYLRDFSFSSATLESTSPSSPSSLHCSPPPSSVPLHSTSLRWDCPSLSCLPGTLTSLSLSSLSSSGVKEFQNSLSSFFNLERLELSKTVFIDDHLLGEISNGLAKSLKRFRIREMSGTKLSDQGLSDLFEGCGELEEFELEGVEGRLSKSCWTKISSYPPRLRSVKLIYSESPPHKSWILDHLQSLPSLLSSVPTLDTFVLSRRIHPESLVPGSHHVARHPIDPLFVPRKLTRQELNAIISPADGGGGNESGGKRWKELNLDLVLVDGESLKKLLENCTELRKLKVCFDNQFKHLLSLSSSFSACLHLQSFSVSIPLEHTPELQSLTPFTYLPSPSSSFSPGSPSPSAGSVPLPPLSPSDIVSSPHPDPTSELPDSIQSLLPPTRDWRRFLKKGSHCLSSIEWTGRGGIGKFWFSKIEGKGLIKIEFEPTRPLSGSAGAGRGIGGGRREREDSWTSSISTSSSSVNNTPFSKMTTRRRRASSTSVTSGGSPATPPKTLGGGGRKFGSIDAAFSTPIKPTPQRRASSSTTTSPSAGFGIIGGAGAGSGGGGGTRRKSSSSSSSAPSTAFDQIGSGWSGFGPSSTIPTSSIPEHESVSPTTSFSLFGLNESQSRGGGLGLDLGSPTSLDQKNTKEKEQDASTGTKTTNVWNSVPPSVTSATPGLGWASTTPTPPLPSAPSTASNDKTKHANGVSKPSASPSAATKKSSTVTETGGGPSSSKMSRGASRSSSSSQGVPAAAGGGGGSPKSSRGAGNARETSGTKNGGGGENGRKKRGDRGSSGAGGMKSGRGNRKEVGGN